MTKPQSLDELVEWILKTPSYTEADLEQAIIDYFLGRLPREKKPKPFIDGVWSSGYNQAIKDMEGLIKNGK